LKPKDVITALDGKTVKSSVELERTIIFSPPGKTVEMNFFRDGEKLSAKVTLDERPQQKKEEKSGESSR
jgi:S1-C subfamily serine protease